MRKLLSIFFLVQLISISSFAQLKVINKTLTDLHVTGNSVSGMVRQPDGKILVLGSVSEGQQYKTALIRFDSTGTLDNTFGQKGVDTFTTINYFPAYQVAYFTAIALQGDKVIIAGGAIDNSGSFTQGDAILMRFTTTGAVDSSFGNAGIAITNAPSNTGISIDEAKSITIDEANRIIMVGKTYDYQKYRFLIARYNPNGSPDNRFSYKGIKVADVGTEDDEAVDVAVYSNKRIVVLGKTYINNENFEVALTALKNNGSFDSSFGNNGIVVSNINAQADVANKLIIQHDNKIVCAGNSGNSVLVLRYKYNGNADTSFGVYGKMIINISSSNCQANSIVLQPDGNMVIGGYAALDSVNHFFVMRLLTNGIPDNSFGNNGVFYNSVYNANDAGYAMSILPGGKILQAGQVGLNASTLFGLVQYTADGLLDNGFNAKGYKTLGIGSSRDVAFKMLRLPWDNSLLLCGTANEFWSLVKYGANKSLHTDKTFGVNGVATVPFMYYGDQFAEPNVAIDSILEKIYMCGLVGNSMYIFKFNRNGTPDSTYGKNGLVIYPGASVYYGGLAVTPNHKIVFAALRQLSTSGYNFAAMLNPDGSPDESFGKNGEVRNLPLTVSGISLSSYNNTLRFAGLAPLKNFDAGIGVLSLKFNGNRDTAFGRNGFAILRIPNGSAEVYFKYSVTEDNYGRTIVGGSIESYNTNSFYFSVSRFTKKGTPDSSFGVNGLATINPGNDIQSNPANEGISVGCTDSKHCYIATAGTEMDSYFKTAKSVIVVYKNDGGPDTLTASSTYWDKNLFGGPYESAYSVLVDNVTPSGYTLYVAGTGGKGDALDFSLVEFQKQITVKSEPLFFDTKAFTRANLYPNPSHGQVTLSYLLEKGDVNIDLIDLNGKVLQEYRFVNNTGQFTTTIQLPGEIAKGVYFLKIINGKNVFVEKLLKE